MSLLNMFYVIFEWCEHHKLNSIQLQVIVVEADILDTDI